MKPPLKITLIVLGAFVCPLAAQSASLIPIAHAPLTESGTVTVTPPLPAGCKATLHFVHPKVAAGAIRQAAHQSEFWIEVRDAQGQPRSNFPVALPVIVRGGQTGQTDEERKAKLPTKMSARLEWLTSTKLAPPPIGQPKSDLALTGKDGRAYGQFTSGQRQQTVEFSIVGNAKASIEQTWNEDPDPFNDGGVDPDEPTLVRFQMNFKRADEKVMIVGHHLELKITSLKFDAFRLTGNLDDEGNPETADDDEVITVLSPDSSTPQSEQDKAFWEEVKNWCAIKQMRDTSDGVYEGYYKITLPADPMIWHGYQLTGVNNVAYDVDDDDAYEDN